MHNLIKKVAITFLAAVLTVSMIPAIGSGSAAGAVAAYAADTAPDCEPLSGQNVNGQDYSTYGRKVYSYLTASGQGYMRVQGNVTDQATTVVYYDRDFNVTSKKVLAEELPIFGAFYAAEDAYYIVTGQSNPKESDAVEVYRITKYDTSWNRIGSCGLYGANTCYPFNFGSCRIDSSGKYLVVRTCHVMYQSDDGYHHQANVTILVDTNAMTVADSFTSVMNSSFGYASHSFNQFVKVENGKIVAVDHGDAYPRSVCLMQYPTDITGGSFQSSRVRTTSVLDIQGATGNNYTGVSVGAFEVTGSSYLVAGNSVPQDEFTTNKVRNIFVASVDKTTNAVSLNWLTRYGADDTSPSTPHLVAVGSGNYMVLWGLLGKVYYAMVGENGRLIGNVHSMNGYLSDCAPILSDGKVIWYTWDESNETFYQIPTATPENPVVIEKKRGHNYGKWTVEKEATTTEKGIKTRTCSVCGYTQSASIAKLKKEANPLKIKVKSKTYKRAKLTKKKSFSIGATKAQGKVTYTLDNKAKKAKIKISSKGKVTVPKKCKKGTYKITVKAAGNSKYKAGKKTVKVVVK